MAFVPASECKYISGVGSYKLSNKEKVYQEEVQEKVLDFLCNEKWYWLKYKGEEIRNGGVELVKFKNEEHSNYIFDIKILKAKVDCYMKNIKNK